MSGINVDITSLKLTSTKTWKFYNLFSSSCWWLVVSGRQRQTYKRRATWHGQPVWSSTIDMRGTPVGHFCHTDTICLFSPNKATSIKLLPLIEFTEGRWEIIIELLCQTLKLKFSMIKMKIVCNTAIDIVFSLNILKMNYVYSKTFSFY